VGYLELGLVLQKIGGDEVMAMAFGRVFFAAHDGGGLLGREGEKLLNAFLKPGALHNKSVVNARFWGGGVVVASGVRGATAKGFTREDVLNLMSRQLLFEVLTVELRVKSTGREGTDVHEALDVVGFEQVNEFVEGVIAVTEGE